MQAIVRSLLLTAFCLNVCTLNVCFGVSIPEISPQITPEISPEIELLTNEVLPQIPDSMPKNGDSLPQNPDSLPQNPDSLPQILESLLQSAGTQDAPETPETSENATALTAANNKLTELKNLNYDFTHAVLNEFRQIRLPLDNVRDLGNAVLLLNLDELELVPLIPFYTYQTNVYNRFNELRDKMNVFDRQNDNYPYRNLPAAQFVRVNNVLDEVLSKTKMNVASLREIVYGPAYQNLAQALVKSQQELQQQITKLVDLAGLFKENSASNENIAEIKNHVLPEIGRIGIDMLKSISEARTTDWGTKIFELFDEIVNVQKDLPTKLEFSFISV